MPQSHGDMPVYATVLHVLYPTSYNVVRPAELDLALHVASTALQLLEILPSCTRSIRILDLALHVASTALQLDASYCWRYYPAVLARSTCTRSSRSSA